MHNRCSWEYRRRHQVFLSCRNSGSAESEDRNICFLIKLKEYQKFYGLSIGSQPPWTMITHHIVFSNHVCIQETKAITEITEAKYPVLIYVLSPQHRNGFRRLRRIHPNTWRRKQRRRPRKKPQITAKQPDFRAKKLLGERLNSLGWWCAAAGLNL